MTVEQNDLEVQLSFAFVLYGKFNEFVKLRNVIREQFPNAKLVFHTISAEHLYILKRSALNAEQLKVFEEKEEKKQK